MPNVYKDKKSKFYQTDIYIDGVKFHRSTKRTREREAVAAAEQIERDLKEAIAAQGETLTSLRLDDVAGRYMHDIGDHHAGAGAAITRSKVDLVVKFFIDKYGRDIALTDIDEDKATQLKNWRRGHVIDTARALLDVTGKYRSKAKKKIGPHAANDTIEQLKKLFTYAKARGATFKHAPNFSKTTGTLWLEEDEPRPRVLAQAESDRLDHASATVHPEYDPLIQFARATGKRRTECLLRWDSVKWERGVIELRGKRNKRITVTITPTIRAILWPLQGHHPEWVFTYTAQRTVSRKRRDGTVHAQIKGRRYPVTKDSLKRQWLNIRVAADIPVTGEDRVRFQDLRHDFASRLLASIPTADGMKVVQTALNHAKLATTMGIYAHVDLTKVADAIEAQASKRLQRRDENHPTNHPTKRLKSV